VLAVALRNAAGNWPEVEAAVARQTAIAGDGSPAASPRVMRGPTDIPCFHDSCLRVRQSQLRAAWSEAPLSGEKNLVSFGALEDAWIVTNTASTWARLVQDETGHPVPAYDAPTPDRAEPKRLTVVRERERERSPKTGEPLCRFSDLPESMCACGHGNHRKDAS
jgi:hypothetical protein